MSHKLIYSLISEKILELGFNNAKDNYFYKEYKNIFGIIKYRKHTFYNGFFIDYGIFFKDYKSYRTIPVDENKWHLKGTLGMLSPAMKLVILIDEIDESQYVVKAEEIKKYIQEYLIPFYEKVNDIELLKKIDIEKDIFNIAYPYPLGIKQDNDLKKFILSRMELKS